MLVNFGLTIFIRSLLHTSNYLIFTPISFLRFPMCWQRMWKGNHILSLIRGQGYHTCDAQTRGGRGSCRWQKCLRWCAREIILARNLLCQAKVWSWVPVWFLVPQGNGEMSTLDNAGVQNCGCNCDPTIDPFTYVWKGSLEFCYHESTQIREYY